MAEKKAAEARNFILIEFAGDHSSDMTVSYSDIDPVQMIGAAETLRVRATSVIARQQMEQELAQMDADMAAHKAANGLVAATPGEMRSITGGRN